jgi:hypothetical protein
MTIPGSVNTDVFLTYIREILAPQLWVGAAVVMDNLPVHQALVIREVIQAVGARVIFYLPIHLICPLSSCAGQNLNSVYAVLKLVLMSNSTKY